MLFRSHWTVSCPTAKKQTNSTAVHKTDFSRNTNWPPHLQKAQFNDKGDNFFTSDINKPALFRASKSYQRSKVCRWTFLCYILFTQTAGYDGTALMFSLLCIFVVSVAFEKKARMVLIVLNLVLLFALCLLAFFYPSLIVPHEGAPAKLLDQLVALVVTVFAMAVLSIYIIDALKSGLRRNQRLLSELEQKNRDLAKLSHIFINLRPDEASMKTSMDMAGSFLGCDALVFLEKAPDDAVLSPKYTWRRQVGEVSSDAGADAPVATVLYGELFTGASLFMVHTDEGGAHLSIPITVDGSVWGVVKYTHCRQENWADSDIQLGILLTNVLSGAIVIESVFSTPGTSRMPVSEVVPSQEKSSGPVTENVAPARGLPLSSFLIIRRAESPGISGSTSPSNE